jgi:nucleolar protein 12
MMCSSVVDEEALRQLFSQCGDVCFVRIVRDRKSGVCKGFGYVHFKDKAVADLALRLHGSEFEGRTIRVFRATDDRKKQKHVRRLEVTLLSQNCYSMTVDSKGL